MGICSRANIQAPQNRAREKAYLLRIYSVLGTRRAFGSTGAAREHTKGGGWVYVAKLTSRRHGIELGKRGYTSTATQKVSGAARSHSLWAVDLKLSLTVSVFALDTVVSRLRP